MPFEVKPKREGANHVFLRKNVPDRGNSKDKVIEIRVNLEHLRNKEKTSMISAW